MTKEEVLLQKRLAELSRTAYTRGIVTYSDFLNLNELNILHTMPKDLLSTEYETFGGYDFAERQMAAFLPDALYYEHQYPICIIEIAPVNLKFAEPLSHRDYLGAIMNLGIDRSKLGDIVADNQRALLYIKEELANYVEEQLTRVRHTVVKTNPVPHIDITELSPRYESIKGTVASIRLDTVLSLAYPVSRSKMTGFIENGSVFVNGRLITSNGYRLQEGDIISVRKMGRICYDGVISETRKGRCMISIRKFC